MQARLIKDKDGMFRILCSDGSIIAADVNNLYYLLTEFRNLGKVDKLSGGAEKWSDEYLDISLYPGENYAYVTDNNQLVIIDFLPFRKLLESLDSSSNMITTAQFGKLHGKSPEQIKVLCRTGRIIGAKKIGKAWMIPEDAPYPAVDNRGKQSGKSEQYFFSEGRK